MISRFKPTVWLAALGQDHAVCQGLMFSYGVPPIYSGQDPDNWREYASRWVREQALPGKFAVLVAGPSAHNPDTNHRIEFLNVGERPWPSLGAQRRTYARLKT